MIHTLARYQFRNIARSRWVFGAAVFFLVFSEALYQASGTALRMQVSMMSVVLIVLPLFGIMYGAMHVYGSREFLEVLVAQPLRRRDIFLSSYLVVTCTVAGCFIIGAGIPVLLHSTAESWISGLLLLLAGALLTAIFAAIAFVIAFRVHDRTRGIGLALLVWFAFSLLYDGVVLFAFHALRDYPVEPIAIAASVLNPVDLARIVLTLQYDVSALLGYTGAVYEKFFGSALGAVMSIIALLLWIFAPLGVAERIFARKDF